MSAPAADRVSFNKTLATFGRMWSAGMIPIIDKSGGWPGFRYTPNEQAEMRKQVERLPNASSCFLLFSFVNAPIAIALFAIPILLMAWILATLQRIHGQFPPEAVFFSIFGATMAVALGIFLPLGVYLTSALFRNRPWNFDLTPADAEFGHRLFHKFCWQTARVAVVASFIMVLVSFWPNESSSHTAQPAIAKPFSFWERSAASLAALGLIGLRVGTLWFYYGPKQKTAQP